MPQICSVTYFARYLIKLAFLTTISELFGVQMNENLLYKNTQKYPQNNTVTVNDDCVAGLKNFG